MFGYHLEGQYGDAEEGEVSVKIWERWKGQEAHSSGPCRIQALILDMIGSQGGVWNRGEMSIFYNQFALSWFKKKKWNRWKSTSTWKRPCRILIGTNLLWFLQLFNTPHHCTPRVRCFTSSHHTEVSLFLPLPFLLWSLWLLPPLPCICHIICPTKDRHLGCPAEAQSPFIAWWVQHFSFQKTELLTRNHIKGSITNFLH